MSRVEPWQVGGSWACWAPKLGQVLSGVEGDNLDRCKSYRFVKLVKPPSLDKCCPSYFLLSCPGRTHFLFCRKSQTCQAREVLVIDNSIFFWPLENALKTSISFVFYYGQVQCTHVTLAYVSLEEWTRIGDVVHGIVGLPRGANFHGIISATANYWRVMPPLKWSIHLIFYYHHFEFMLFLLKLSCLLLAFCDFPFFSDCLFHFKVLFLSTMSFISNSAMVMGESDSRGGGAI